MSSANEYLWFLNTLVRVRVSHTEGPDGLSVIEHQAPWGDSPPLHCHRTEDEFFHILEGEFLFQLGDVQKRVGPGAMLLVPQGAVHSYRVESKTGGRFVTVTRGGDFERFVRAISRPAERSELPAPSGPPGPEAMATLAGVAGAHGIFFMGPPLH